MSSEVGGADDPNLAYNEHREIIEAQIDENHHLERQAGLMLRLIITMTGILLSAASIAIRPVIPQLIAGNAIDVGIPSIEEVADLLAQEIGPLSAASTGFLTAILTTSGVILLFVAVANIFVRTPWRAFQVLQPTPVGIGTRVSSGKNIEDVTNYLGDLVEENSKSLETARKDWELCQGYMKKGFLWLAGAFVVFVPVYLIQRPLFVVTALLLILILVFGMVYENISYFKVIAFSDPIVDTASVILFITTLSVFYFAPMFDLWVWVWFLVTVGATLSIFFFKNDLKTQELLEIGARDTAITIVLSFFLIISLPFVNDLSNYTDHVVFLILSLLWTYFMTTLGLALIYAISTLERWATFLLGFVKRRREA